MRTLGVLLAVLLLGYAFAAPMGPGGPGGATDAPRGPVTERYTVMEKIGKGYGYGGPVVAGERGRVMAMRMEQVMKQSMYRVQNRYTEWMEIRNQFMAGLVDENTYLETTKTFITELIDTTIERLTVIYEETNDENVATLIDQLEAVKTDLENRTDLTSLRDYYRTVVKPILSDATELVKEYYAGSVIMAFDGVIYKLENTYSKIKLWVERVGADVDLTVYESEINTIKAEIEQLKEAYLNGEVTADEVLSQLRNIRERINSLFAELRRTVMGVA